MERVQFQQEQMLAELKDLVQKGLFTAAETKQIMKKRTVFETTLIRRIVKKSDFLRYAAYEMGLEQLRRKRVERLKLPPSPPSVSDYALVRRQFHIFERALKKFKDDVGMWIQYIQVAKREGARSLVGRITARALQLHPNTPALYILAASHELDHLSPSAARALLQRGIRLNSENVEMWSEYVKMELGFIESLRRRWDVLGIDVVESGNRKGKDIEKEREMDIDIDGEDHQMELDEKEDVEEEDESARNAIMEGAIVKSVMSSAAQALPKINLFTALETLITTYPLEDSLRETLLAHLYGLLRETLPVDPRAVKLFATRRLSLSLEGEEFVDALKSANEDLLGAIGRAGVDQVYTEFVEEWVRMDLDENLRQYLISSLHSLIQGTNNPRSCLLAARVRLLRYTRGDSAKHLKLARKYSAKSPKSAEVWMARLDVEKEHASDDVEKTWIEGRGMVEGDGTEKVWMWWFDKFHETAGIEEQRRNYKGALKATMRDSSLASVHEALLMGYTTLVLHEDGGASDDEMVNIVRHIAGTYMPTARVWKSVFEVVRENGRVCKEVFEKWRRTDGVEATITWAVWLLKNGKAKDAKEVVVCAGSWLDEEEKKEVESRWTKVIDANGD